MESNTTNKAQIAILVVLVLLFIAIMAASPMLKGSPLASTDKRLRAKAGTERKGARALVGESAPATPEEQLKGTRDEPLGGWDAPKNWERLKELQNGDAADNALAAEVVNTLNPEEGIEAVRALLAEERDVGSTVDLYAALGRLYAFRDPPDLPAAGAAFDRAADLAPSAEARHRIVRDRIVAIHESSTPEEVLALIDATIRPEDDVGLATLQLRLLRAGALEKLGRGDEAVAIYEAIMQQTLAMREENAIEAEDIFRQGALRLARLYRETGREDEATEVANKVRHMEDAMRHE